MEFHPQDIFNERYVLKELLGRGSFGEVWLAYDNITGIDVALKIYIALDSRGLADFRNEYRSVYDIEHPNILKPMHFAVWKNQPYLVMHYCPVSSESLIGELSENDIWKFIADISSGLAYLHEQDIIHRDIKPDNILRDSRGRYVLTDFGLSKRLRASLRRNSTRAQQEDVSGALSYMGPELFEAKPEAVKATDIWALGVTIYEMLVGELPFMGQGGIMLKNGADIPELPDKYSYGLRKLVHDCLQKNPWDRPMASQLAGYKGLEEPRRTDPSPKDSWIKRLWRAKAFRVTLLTSAIVCLVWIAAVKVYDTYRWRQWGQKEIATLDTTIIEDAALPTDTMSLQGEENAVKQGVTSLDSTVVSRRDELTSFAEEHHYVDLGLSVLWATCNVGANSPEGYGDYYAWGETDTKDTYTSENYKWFDTNKKTRLGEYLLTKYNADSYYGRVDNKSKLDAIDDVATVKWGNQWRIPTYVEWNELRKRCSWVWVMRGDVQGYIVTSKVNSNSIFLPAAGEGGHLSCVGHYWASTISYAGCANSIDFDDKSKQLDYYAGWRQCGYSIRPVRTLEPIATIK